MDGWIDEVLVAVGAMDRGALIEQIRRALEEISRLRSENDSQKKELERLLRQQGRGHGARKKRKAQPRERGTGAGAPLRWADSNPDQSRTVAR